MRHVLTIRSDADRVKVIDWLKRAPVGHRIEVKEPKRSDEQNDRMWAMLTAISKAATINGKHYDAAQWKCIFMKALGKEAQFLPTLDGSSFFPTGFRSSDLSVSEMTALMDFMEAWAAQEGVPI